MKKIFTIILAAAGTISFASAQSFDGKNVAFNDHKKIVNNNGEHNGFGKTNSVNYNDAKFLYQGKQEKASNINREFDDKIASIENDHHLNRGEKTRQIQLLQNQRNNEIKKLDLQYVATDHNSRGSKAKYKF